MVSKHQCAKCGGKKFWKIRRQHLKCQRCKAELSQRIGQLNLATRQWKQIIQWFVLEQSANRIQEQTTVSKYQILKALKVLREKMLIDIPEVFSGIVEVDETFLGPRMRNRRLKEKRAILLAHPGLKKVGGYATVKQPVFGILCRSGKVWAEVVAGIEARDIQPLIERRVSRGSTICSDTWRAYTGLATKGYVHRLVKHRDGEYSDLKGNHINGLEGFWGYLKRKLQAKGGIRKAKLPFYLGEYVWRYNHRNLTVKEQTNYLFKLVAET